MTPHTAVPTDLQLIRLPAVEKLTGKKKSSLYANIANGTWPPPVSAGGRTSAWPLHECRALLAARISGADDEAIRALVKNLIADRKNILVQVLGGESAAARSAITAAD